MDVKIENLKTPLIEDSTYRNYVVRLGKLEAATGQSLEWIMRNPVNTLRYIKAKLSANPSTIANFIVVVCKLYSTHPRYVKVYAGHYATWQKYLRHYRKVEAEKYKKSDLTAKQEKNVVGWQEVEKKYCALGDAAEVMTNYKEHQAWLLMSVFLNMNAKRADLGNVRIWDREPRGARERAGNYLVLKPKPVLVLNRYKTAKVRGEIREPLNAVMARDVRASLRAFPREYLIVNSRGDPYLVNNSYSQYVKRIFLKYFGRAMGVSLWRNVYITANVDFNETSYEELERNAHYKGHSLQQEFMTYRKKGMFHKRAVGDKGQPVTCNE